MLDFNNTQKAFSGKSNYELYNANLLFNVMKHQWIVSFFKGFVNVARKIHFPLAWAVKPTLYKQFVGGEQLEDCIKTMDNLAKFGIKSVLDYSAEGGGKPEDIENMFRETMKSIEFAKNQPNIAYTVFKPSGLIDPEICERLALGMSKPDFKPTDEEQKEYEAFKNRFNALLEKAAEYQVRILVDAEDFTCQPLYDQLAEEGMRRHNKERAIVFQTLQMYRKDRLDYLKWIRQDTTEHKYIAGVKFVRGAYMEEERRLAAERGYPSPICETKADTDVNYDAALEYSVENIEVFEIFNGTHNYRSNQYIAELIDKKGLKRDDQRIYSSQLFGMSDNISFNLASEGYNVCKYIPYAPVNRVLPYLLRRAQENTSMAGQTNRELELLRTEVKRRKK
jgi:proline dehydrogenase